MPQLNPDKGLVQLPLRHNVTIPSTLPDDWLMQLGRLIAEILQLPNAGETAFLSDLNHHAGDNATYALKPQLHESLKVLYTVLSNATTDSDQKQAIALKLFEGVSGCTPGFHNRSGECVISLSIPQSIDELLNIYRQGIVSRAANATTTEVHAHNRFFVVAQVMGYGVRPLSSHDMHRGDIADNTIREKIEKAFAAYYIFFPVLNDLFEQIHGLIRSNGYKGRREAGYPQENVTKFIDTFKLFIGINVDTLFDSKYDDDDVPKLHDINWLEVKKAILKKVLEEKIFLLSAAEATELNALTSDTQLLTALTPASMSLIQTTDDLVSCLTFFRELSIEKKAELVAYYLKDKSPTDQKTILDKLVNLTDLGEALQSAPALQKICLRLAANEGNLDKVKALMAKGEDVNEVLGILIGKQKAAAMNDPAIRAAINVNGLNTIIPEGQHQGKTVADAWVNSKQGRYWLAEDTRLQSLFPTALTPASMSLRQTTDDLVSCLTFFRELSIEKKAELVAYYLKDKSPTDQKTILDKLVNLTDLGEALQSAPALQKICLRLAANEGNLDKVKALMAKGEDVNEVLGILIGKQKAAAMNDPAIRAAINVNGLNTIVPEGQHQGKTVADAWVNSKRGRYWLAEDTRLQSLFPDMVDGKQKAAWLQQVQVEKTAQSFKLFTPVNPLVSQFLQHIVYGEQAQAEAMLQTHANMAAMLLTTAGKVKDYSGRTIKAKALQLALGAEDVKYGAQDMKYHSFQECMTEMLMRHLNQLPNGEDEIAAQIIEQFPEGWEIKETERAQRDLAELNKVVNAIASSQTNDDCEAALQAFRDYLEHENKGKGVIKTGKHFNIGLLVNAFKLWEQKYDDFGGHDSRKNNVFLRNVIGYTQRFLPACYAQAICQGSHNIVEKRAGLKRSLKIQLSAVEFYPLDSSRGPRLGFDYAVGGIFAGYLHTQSNRISRHMDMPESTYLQAISDKNHQRCVGLRQEQAETITRRMNES